jgi:hypothetical protein
MLQKPQSADDYLKWIIGGSIAVMVVVMGWFVYKESVANPLAPKDVSTEGFQTMVDLGRNHVDVGTQVKYNSNPPTSGSHYVEWTKAGVYDKAIDDGHLVHSLEHGYIIISYNCAYDPKAEEKKEEPQSLIPVAFAQEATPTQASKEDPWKSDTCKELKTQLEDIARGKVLNRLIVIPRPKLDSHIALTAWTKLYKTNTVDRATIERFIDAFRNKGPEKTVE